MSLISRSALLVWCNSSFTCHIDELVDFNSSNVFVKGKHVSDKQCTFDITRLLYFKVKCSIRLDDIFGIAINHHRKGKQIDTIGWLATELKHGPRVLLRE